MQYMVHDPDAPSRLASIEAALVMEDPTALVDLAAGGRTLRIATLLPEAALLGILLQTGGPLAATRVERVPSECCGGCGG